MPGTKIPSGLCLCLAAFLSLPQAQDPALVGRFNAPIPTQVVPIHVMLLPNGKLLYLDRHDQGSHDMTPRLWDIATGAITKTPTPPYDLFCSGHSMLRDGNILFSGGHVVDGQGLVNLAIYNWRTNAFETNLPRMYKARWYPSNTTLPNGDVLISSGTYEWEKYTDMPEVFETRTRTLRALDNAVRKLEMYPFMYVMPGGKVFAAGPDSLTRMLDVAGRGKWTDVGMTTYGRLRNYGSSVRYAPGRILASGGDRFPPTATAETIDLNAAAPAWKAVDPMHFGRRHHTLVMLPDGKVLATGGTGAQGFNHGSGAVYDAEMWDPETGKWTLMAKAKNKRLYHSVSLLLPDGRVATGGGGHPGDEANFLEAFPEFEIYEPPYLFKGTRPVIGAAPDSIYYGKSFTVESGTPGTLKASLLRMACVTHAWDHNADFNRLTVKRLSPTTLQIEAPADSALTVPGPHMLFLLDSAGVPSKAKILWLFSAPGNNSVAGTPRGPKVRLVVAGNRLRTPGNDLGADALCSLRDTRGRLAAVVARGRDGDFPLPAGLRRGTYLAELSAGGLRVTERILIP